MSAPQHNYRSLCFVVLVVLAGLMSDRLTAATPKIGGGSCSTSMVTGTYFYVLAGTVSSGGQGVPYAELGELIADGSGNVSGKSFASVNGQPGTYPCGDILGPGVVYWKYLTDGQFSIHNHSYLPSSQ